jgi:hypothetical protein
MEQVSWRTGERARSCDPIISPNPNRQHPQPLSVGFFQLRFYLFSRQRKTNITNLTHRDLMSQLLIYSKKEKRKLIEIVQ